MILDTSALVCLHEGEPDANKFLSVMLDAGHLQISAGTLIETYLALDSRQPLRSSRRLDQLLADLQPTIVPVDEKQVSIARAAFRDYGKGSGHPAGLNFGDCFAYALSSLTREPLLFKGDDFSHTDITAALP